MAEANHPAATQLDPPGTLTTSPWREQALARAAELGTVRPGLPANLRQQVRRT